MIIFCVSLEALTSQPPGAVSFRWQASRTQPCAISFKASVWALQATAPWSAEGQGKGLSAADCWFSFEEQVVQILEPVSLFALRGVNSSSRWMLRPLRGINSCISLDLPSSCQVRRCPVHCRPPDSFLRFMSVNLLTWRL